MMTVQDEEELNRIGDAVVENKNRGVRCKNHPESIARYLTTEGPPCGPCYYRRD